jgi:transglutaminase-like putative cysteine protease
MIIQVGYDIVFEHVGPTPIVAMLYLHPSVSASVRRGEHLLVEPNVTVSEYTDVFGNRCGRLVAPAGLLRLWNDAVVENDGEPDVQQPFAPQLEIVDLPPETIQFLISSRYCEVDQMVDIAWQLFGTTPKNWTRVQAICEFVHHHITFDYLRASSTRTAYQAYGEKVGVCRDFTHLAITFCRCMNIPARYCTGYLGDIGVPPAGPMDFSAWMEVYLGDRWYPFDPRNLIPRIGRVLMATGRDAADVALTTAFGPSRLNQFSVWADEIDAQAFASSSIRSIT